MNITITRVDGGLHINHATPYLTKYLKYSHRAFKVILYKKQTVYEERLLHELDGAGGLVTMQGFFVRICELIHKNGDTFNVQDLREPMPEINWQAISDLNPRDYQIDAIAQGLTAGLTNSGIFKATGGYGKTYCQAFTYAAWSDLNTILAIPIKQVFTQTYEKFIKLFPNKHVGRVGDGFHDISKDITITTFRSLDKCATEKCKLLLIDEVQSVTGDYTQNVISSIKALRTFGYTATDKGLFNGADKIIKGICGERLIDVPYEEAQEIGAVVPGLVYFVRMPEDIIISATSFEGAISQGIKNCKKRNELVGKVCASTPKDWQTLVFVEHVKDHLVKLFPHMPIGTKFVHRDSDKKSIGSFALTGKQQKEIIKEFTNGEFNTLIATDAFKAGVDIPQLRVVVQASGGSSEIEILQEALRGSRTLLEADKERLKITQDKTHFVLVDFLDNHDEKLHNMAKARMKIYEQQGWKVKIVDRVEDIDWYDFKNEL